MINIKDIKTIDVLHASFDSDGELVDNFAIVDTLLEHIEQLEADLTKSKRYECSWTDCGWQKRGRELEGLIDRIAEDDNPDNFWQEDARVMRAERNHD